VAGLIDVEPRLPREILQEFLIGLFQRPAHLADDLGQLPAPDGQADDVADELADGRVRGMTDSLEVGDDGGEARPRQAAALDRQRERGVIFLGAVGTPPRMTAVLVDLQRHGGDVDLLNHDGLGSDGLMQSPSTRGAEVQEVIVSLVRQQFGREEGALVGWVSGLSAGLASGLSGRRLQLGGLDDIGRRRLGGSRGILARRSELPLQLVDGVLECIMLGAQGIDFRLQPLAIGTGGYGIGFHGGKVYTSRVSDSTL
jgi:hypothetical protein